MSGLTARGERGAGAEPVWADANRVLGVVGGMGPLASADFVRTIYEGTAGAAEQKAPQVLLWSDPDVVDRSEAIALGELRGLTDAIRGAVEGLLGAGAGWVVIACVTAHAVLAELPVALRQRVISLVDVVYSELEAVGLPQVLLCTEGSISARVFERHPAWEHLSGLVVRPDARDQRRIHDMVYELKHDRGVDEAIDLATDLVAKYQVAGCIAGCTEFHTVVRALSADWRGRELSILDPLAVLAERIRAGSL